MLNETHRKLLMSTVRARKNGYFSGTVNPALEAAIEQIKQEAPHAFHDEHSLRERVFMDQPMGSDTPYKECVNYFRRKAR